MTRLAALAAAALLLPGCLSAHLPIAPAGGRALEIVGVDAPASARVGQPVAVKLTTRLYGSCARVGDARAVVDGQALTVTLQGTATTTLDGASPCTDGVREEVVAVGFTPTNAGTYRLAVPHGIERARLERTISVVE